MKEEDQDIETLKHQSNQRKDRRINIKTLGHQNIKKT